MSHHHDHGIVEKMATVFTFSPQQLFFINKKFLRPQEGNPQMRGGIAKLRPGHARRRGKFGVFFLDESSEDLTDLTGFFCGGGRLR